MLELKSHYLLTMPDGSPQGLQVILGNDEGGMYPVLLSPEYHGRELSEIQHQAREVMYQKEFPGRAEAEKFLAYEQALGGIRVAAQEAREATVANREAVDKAILEMTELVGTIYAQMQEAIAAIRSEGETDE